MTEKTLIEISKKLNILISLTLKQLNEDKEFGNKPGRKKSIGDIAHYLFNMGLDAKDIAEIIDAPLQSIRTLLTPKRRK